MLLRKNFIALRCTLFFWGGMRYLNTCEKVKSHPEVAFYF